MSRVVLIAVGNTLRGDDGAAWSVAEHLARRWDVRTLVDVQPLPEWAVDLADAEIAYLVDARGVGAGGDGVEIAELPARLAANGSPASSGGHALSLAALLDLAASLYGRSPPARLVSLPTRQVALGAPLSDVARRGVAEATGRLDDCLARDGVARHATEAVACV